MLPRVSAPCDVSVPTSAGRGRRAGIRVHRSRTLLQTDVTLRNRIPVTTPVRTIADLRDANRHRRPGALPAWEIRKALRQANVIGLSIDKRDTGDRTRSDLERDFLRLCSRHRLSPPEVNVRIGPYLVDFLWRERRFVVETDGYLYHRGEVAFQEDRARDLGLVRRGFEVLRISGRQLNDESAQVAEVLAAKLAWAGDAARQTRGRG
jgi:very-short-patch-repair endonuclease